MRIKRVPAAPAVVQKEFMARTGARFRPVYLVNEYPKSGGTWLKFMLADALGVPAWTRGRPVWRSCVMQAHWITEKPNCRTIVQFRDGRDVMVSFYYHSFFKNQFRNELLVKRMRQRFNFDDFNDIRSNLLPFMEGMFQSPESPAFTWRAFVRYWANMPNVLRTRYEDLRQDTATELKRLMSELGEKSFSLNDAASIAERYSMQNMRENAEILNPRMTGRQESETDFIRKGSVAGWSGSFTDEALVWFEANHGDELERLGYRLGRPNAD